jgi:hypothetical protein
MPSAIVYRVAGWRKVGIGECSNGDAYSTHLTFLGVEEVRSAEWTEAEPELSPLIARADVFGGLAEDLVRGRKACKCCEDAARSLLAGEAMADADKARLTFDFDAKLPTVTRGCTGRHRAPRRLVFVPPNAAVQQRAASCASAATVGWASRSLSKA